MGAHELRWAFRRWPPLAAIDYFVQRGSNDDLKWPITYLLHGLDHPNAVLFVVHELAAIRRRLEGTNSVSPFLLLASDEWRNAQVEYGHPMSQASRDVLLQLWQDTTNDKHLRVQAFSFWAATKDPNDIEILRIPSSSAELADKILSERLTRGDQEAIPAMLAKLATDDHGYWWQYGRYLWSPELTNAMDEHLERRGTRAKRTWCESIDSDWITSEMVMRLQESEAERLLLKHWAHLRFAPDFVQTALYISTPRLLDVSQTAINECPEPAKLLQYLSHTFGIRTKGHVGITREAQVRALGPFLHLLSPTNIWSLWEECNDHGWFNLRHELLDSHLRLPFLDSKWDSNQVVIQLDKMVSDERSIWIDHWIGSYLKTGVGWAEILGAMTTWFDQRRSLEALKVVAAAIQYRGTREDLTALTVYEGMPEIESSQLITDTQFAVRRRSIH